MSTYEISKSSLLSLKAEILKKQEELNKAKLENKVKVQKDVKKGPLEFKNKGVESRRALDVNSDDEDLHRKSRKALEAKSKLYNKLAKATHDPDDTDENRKYLVQFSKKSKEQNTKVPCFIDDSDEDDVNKYPESDTEEPVDYNDYRAEHSDDEWVEYTDCFGRTRTCLRKDLPAMKEKDKDIRPEANKSADDNEKENETNEDHVSEGGDFSESSELLSADMRRELLRQQWEKEEGELRDKKNIHYQDILFSEARTHGVGYYGFSKDEDVREKQQEALNKLRKETQEQQKMAQEIKKNREKQLKARILAAKNRKRARMSLPPLEEDDEPDEKTTEKVEEESKKELPEEDLQKEREKAAARKRHVRPWDIGKEGVKEHVEYTQEEWVEIQRKKRDNEFAPPRTYNSTTMNDIPEPSQSKGLYFSSKKSRREDDFVIDTSRPPPRIKNPAKKSVNPYKLDDDEEDRLLRDYRNAQEANPGKKSVNPYRLEDVEEDRLLRDYRNTQEASCEPIEDDRLMRDYRNAQEANPAKKSVNPYKLEDDEEDRLLRDYRNTEEANPAKKSENRYRFEAEEEDRLLRDYRNAQEASCKPNYDPMEDDRLMRDYRNAQEANYDPTADDRLMRDYRNAEISSFVNPYKSSCDFIQTPIEDESIDEYEDDRLLRDYQHNQNRRGAGVEVAPPPTYEYYGPSGSKPRSNVKTGSSIEDSIMEGLKFLREKVEEKKSKRRKV